MNAVDTNAAATAIGPAEPTSAPTDAVAAAPPFQAVGFLLSSLGHAVSRRFHEALAPLALEPKEFALLRAVGVYEGNSQQALAERVQIPPSRMVAFVDALEERGLLERRPNPTDRRARALYLTADGQRLLARAFALAVAFEQQLCADLDDEQRAQLIESLQRIAASIGLPAGAHAAHAAMAEGCVQPEPAP